MCSRYNLTSPPEAVRAYFALSAIEAFPPRPNIAPTEPVAIVRRTASGGRELHLVRWGLVPSWAKEPRQLSLMINARCESAAEKPSFRGGMRHRRCLVPADGFYEWVGPPRRKVPHLFRPRSGGLMALAGIAEHWISADGSELESMAILTTAANATVAPIHDRMPVIIPPEAFDRWLDCRPGTAVGVQDLLKPAPDDLLVSIAVSRELNRPGHTPADLFATEPTDKP